MGKILLEVQNLTKYFTTPAGQLHAVDGVSFQIEEGKTLGIVGESGCGKSTTGRTILKLIQPTSGKIIFDGQDITNYSTAKMRKLRTEMQIIFQDPFSSLDPRQSVLQLISEPMIEHKLYKSKAEVEKRALELMETVGLARRYMNVYPHELDGGRRQRIGVARALSVRPKLIICDEPVSALDVSIQAQILNLLRELQRNMGLTFIFIAFLCLFIVWFRRTKLGQDMRAVGQDMEVAKAAGINVDRTRIISVVMSTVCAGFGMVIYLQNIGNLPTYTGHAQIGMFCIAALLVGGASVEKAGIGNAFLGVILFHMMFIVAPGAGAFITGDSMVGEYFRVFLSYGVITLALIMYEAKKRMVKSKAGRELAEAQVKKEDA